MTETTTTEAKPTGLQFGGVSKDAAEKARKRVKSSGNTYFKLQDGQNAVRFLPPPAGSDQAWVITYQHFYKAWAGGKKHFSFNCPKEMGQGRCPGCDAYEKLLATGNPIDKEKAKDHRAKARVFANIIDRRDEEAGVQVLAFGSMILEQLCELIEDDDIYGADFTHPFEGDDLAIKRFTENKFIKYKVNIRQGDHDRLAIEEEQMVKWMETAPNLDQYAVVLDYAMIKAKGDALAAEARGEVPVPAIAAPAPGAVDTTAVATDSFSADASTGLTTAAASEDGQSAETPF